MIRWALAGLLLAGILWFAVIPTVLGLHAQHSGLVMHYNPRLVDLSMVVLNVALLTVLVGARHFLGQRQRPSA